MFSVYNKPPLLTMDAFKVHKKSVNKVKAQEDFTAELMKINTTVSIIPRGCTGYVQVLDVSINKIIKNSITEQEEAYYDLHEAEWEAGKFTVSDRRILLTHWVAKAWKDLHEYHKDTIISKFKRVGLALNPDGSKDWKLKIRDLPGLILLS
jgi:hypothetical protein